MPRHAAAWTCPARGTSALTASTTAGGSRGVALAQPDRERCALAFAAGTQLAVGARVAAAAAGDRLALSGVRGGEVLREAAADLSVVEGEYEAAEPFGA